MNNNDTPRGVFAAATLIDALPLSAQATALCERIRARVFPNLAPVAVVLAPFVIGPYCRAQGVYLPRGEAGTATIYALARYHSMTTPAGRYRMACLLAHELCHHGQAAQGWSESGKSQRRGTHRNAEWRASVKAVCDALVPNYYPAPMFSGAKARERSLCRFPFGAEWRHVRDALRPFVG
jgi:hypothetical protein